MSATSSFGRSMGRWLAMLGWSGLDLHGNRARQQNKWARCRAHLAGRDAKIFCCGCQAAMAKQQLDGANIGARFQQVNRKGVTQGMRCDRFRDFANRLDVPTLQRNGIRRNMPTRLVAWKEPVLRPFHSP